MAAIHYKWRRSIVLLPAILISALLSGLVATSSASADFIYCNHGVSAYSECSDTPGGGFWAYNIAEYTGSGTVSVCERGDRVGGGQISRICANNYVSDGSDFRTLTDQGVQTIPHVGNNSAYYHTIIGHSEPVAHTTSSPTVLTLALPNQAPAVSASALPASLTSAIGALRRQTNGRGEITTLSTDQDTVSLKMTADDVCLSTSQHGGVLTCNAFANTTAGDLEAAIVCSPLVASDRVLVYGLVPDGATSVQAIAGSETVASTPVEGNTYRLNLAKQAAGSITGFAWTTSAGAVHAMSDVLPSDLSCDS